MGSVSWGCVCWGSSGSVSLALFFRSASAALCFAKGQVQGAKLLGIVLLVVGLGLPLAYFVSFALSMKQQIVNQGLKRPRHVYTLVLTERAKGISVSNETEHADYEWKKIHHVYRGLLDTYIFITPARGFILPHHCIEEGEEELWDLIRRKVDPLRTTDLRK